MPTDKMRPPPPLGGAVGLRIQYMSDLHLEISPGFRIAPEDVVGDLLILAGDIGDPESEEYSDFIRDCVSKFGRAQVYVILGNHEAYEKPSWEYTVDVTRRTLAGLGATLLHRDAVHLANDLTLLGATLWSRVDGEENHRNVQAFISDYRRIGGITRVDTTNEMHADDVAWLRRQIDAARAENRRVIVATHHAPSKRGTSHPRHADCALNCSYATDLEHMFVNQPTVVAWIFGHTHHACELFSGRLLSNPRGLVNFPEQVAGFVPSKVVHPC